MSSPSPNTSCYPGLWASSTGYDADIWTDASQLPRALVGYLRQSGEVRPSHVHFSQDHCPPLNPHPPALQWSEWAESSSTEATLQKTNCFSAKDVDWTMNMAVILISQILNFLIFRNWQKINIKIICFLKCLNLFRLFINRNTCERTLLDQYVYNIWSCYPEKRLSLAVLNA